jgi:hypothetical protein
MSISDLPGHSPFALSDLIQKEHGIICGDVVKIPIPELPTEPGKNHFCCVVIASLYISLMIILIYYICLPQNSYNISLTI